MQYVIRFETGKPEITGLQEHEVDPYLQKHNLRIRTMHTQTSWTTQNGVDSAHVQTRYILAYELQFSAGIFVTA